MKSSMRYAVLSLCAASGLAGAAEMSLPAAGTQVTDSAQAAALFKANAERAVQPFVVPALSELPGDGQGEQGALVRYGHDLIKRTSELIGPRAPDAALRHSRNDLNCVSCHQAGESGLPGSKAFSLPLANVRNDYPKIDPKSMKVTTIEMRIAGMLGAGATPIKADSREMRAMVAYIDWLGSKSLPGRAMNGAGLDEAIAMPARAASVAQGAQLYAAKCSACHGAQGLGLKNPGFEQGTGYLFPPIAGDDAYDDGGHMYMLPLLTRFLRTNMPLGASTQQPLLSVDEAYDIAAFVNSELPRKHNTARPNFYPDPRYRATGFAIPENFPGDAAAYQKARLGPFDTSR